MASDPRNSPAMRQFARFKQQHPECVLLFRMGDFYEMFDDDAVAVSKAIGLTLTERTKGVPMAGVPHHQLDVYLRRLVDAGFRVAVCDQVQDPKEAKGIVDRAVTRVVTPGTLVDDMLLADDDANKVAAVCFLESGDDSVVAVAIAELSTGSFTVLDCEPGSLVDELARHGVHELLYAETADGVPPPRVARVLEGLGISGTARPGWQFREAESREAVTEQYGVSTVAGFGLAEDDPVLRPAGALIRYLWETQPADPRRKDAPARLSHLLPPTRRDAAALCTLDAVSLRALEVERTIRSGRVEGSLLGLFQERGVSCRTPMGKRLLHEWLCTPLAVRERIEARQSCVATLHEDQRTAEALGGALDGVQDVARIGGRLALGRATPRDVVALGRSLDQLDAIASAVEHAPAFAAHRDRVLGVRDALAPLAERILSQCVERPPAHLREGGLFRDGVDAALDEARSLQRDAGAWLAEYQSRLVSQYDLPNLKVGYNKVFGYYIELPSAQARRAPAELTRKQTLKNAERYITPELKEFEDKVATAEARAVGREQALFDELCRSACERLAELSRFADVVAELDVLGAFAARAARSRWVRPRIVDEPVLVIHGGRHPVLDELLGANFVANDLELGRRMEGDGMAPRLALITGPNMSGKSTFIRQTALIVLLSHTGCFVPADRATIGVCDRIFTRVGADDALHAGQSTFMVEMVETANILNHATGRSLVVLDEIGRGTSTLDGLSLAWAITEHLCGASDPDVSTPRVLFATHYHELTDMEERLPGRVMNLHVAVREWGDEVVFLHRIQPGRTNQSYGVHVARLAGVPESVSTRATEVLDSLSVHHGPSLDDVPEAKPAARDGQLSLFTEYVQHPVVDELRQMDPDHLSPMQAFEALRRLREMLDRP